MFSRVDVNRPRKTPLLRAGFCIARKEYWTEPLPTNPTTKWTATDHLGSPRVVTDSNGAVVSRRDFMPFGEELNANIGNRLGDNAASNSNFTYGANDNIRQKFTGYQKDTETGLDFAEARMYENRHGRFTAVDPLLASGKNANPQSFNRYAYVINNPLMFTDPDGLQVAQQQYCTGCTPAFNSAGGLRVFGRDEKIDRKKWTPITAPQRFDGQSGRKYWLTPTSSEQYDSQDQPNATISPLSNGVNDGVNDAGTGSWNGLRNFGIGVTNFLTQPGGQYGTMLGIPNPFAISPYPYENLRQARFGTGVEVGLPTGLGFGFGAISGTSTLSVVPETAIPSFASAEARATQLHRLLDPIAQGRRTTAVVDGLDESGNFVRIVGSNERRLSVAQRSALRPFEIEAQGRGHAEVTALRTAQNLGITPIRVGASRLICPACQTPIVQSRVTPLTPFRMVRRVNE